MACAVMCAGADEADDARQSVAKVAWIAHALAVGVAHGIWIAKLQVSAVGTARYLWEGRPGSVRQAYG